MKVRNYIYAPVKNEGYRPFTDAPPSVTNILQDAIAHLKPSSTAQYEVLQAIDSSSKDDTKRHRDFFSNNLVLAMYKYSSQKDQYDREGLRFYHVIVVEQIARLLRVDDLRKRPELAFVGSYGNDPNAKIETLLSYASKDPEGQIDEIFRDYFISAEALESSSSIAFRSEKHPTVKPAKRASSGAIAQLSTEVPAPDAIDAHGVLLTQIRGILLIIVVPLLLAIAAIEVYSAFFLIRSIKHTQKQDPSVIIPPRPVPSSATLVDMSTLSDLSLTNDGEATKAPDIASMLTDMNTEASNISAHGNEQSKFMPIVMSADAVHAKIMSNEKCIVIDSNSWDYYVKQHIPNAIHYATKKQLIDSLMSDNSEGIDVVFYGDGAYNIASQYGFKNPRLRIYYLANGFEGWKKSGFPVARE